MTQWQSMRAAVFLLAAALAPACELRVLTWNIHHGEGTDGKLDLARIGARIREARPDLVSLQEVDVRAERTARRDTVRELERLTGLRGVFGMSMPFQGGGYGNAVLVHGTILGSRVFPIPASPGMEPRSLLLVETRPYRCREEVALLATHFDHKSAEDRQAAAEMANLPMNLPAILAGDLNAPPDSLPLAILSQHWRNTASTPQLTSPADQPKRQIDYILLRPKDRWEVINVEALDEAVASDHRPLLATVRLLP
jgi:endonuclease/exonuclease/phosphatase family metal-dependent hydrolase